MAYLKQTLTLTLAVSLTALTYTNPNPRGRRHYVNERRHQLRWIASLYGERREIIINNKQICITP